MYVFREVNALHMQYSKDGNSSYSRNCYNYYTLLTVTNAKIQQQKTKIDKHNDISSKILQLKWSTEQDRSGLILGNLSLVY